MSTPDTDAHQALLDSIDQMAGNGEAPDAVIQAAADGLRAVTDLDQIFIMVRDGAQSLLRMRCAALGAYERAQIRDSANLDLCTVTVPLDDEPMLADFFAQGQLAELEGISQVAELARAIAPHERIAAMAADAVRNQGIGYACVVPIATNHELLGVVIASRYGRNSLSEEDSALVRAVAGLLGTALNHSQG